MKKTQADTTTGDKTSPGEEKVHGLKTKMAVLEHKQQKLRIDQNKGKGDKRLHINKVDSKLTELEKLEEEQYQLEAAMNDNWTDKLVMMKEKLTNQNKSSILFASENDDASKAYKQFKEQDPEKAREFKDRLTLLYHKQYEDPSKTTSEKSTTWLLFKGNSVGRRIWDWLIIATALYATITAPIQLAWEPWGTKYEVADGILFFIYIIDVLVQMRTIYTDILGNEVTDSRTIAKHYLLSVQFIIDLMSLISNPFTAKIPAPTGKYIRLFALIKAQRYFRIGSIIADSDSTLQVKGILQIMYIVVLVFLYVHITGCLFFYIQNVNPKNSWIPPFDYIDGSKSVYWWKDREAGIKADWTYQYGVCLYYCMLAIGGNELGPADNPELTYVIFLNVFGLILKVYLFGELSGLLSILGNNAANQQKVIDTANVAMSNMDLDEGIRDTVRDYFKRVQDTADKQNELEAFFKQISPSLKKMIQSEIFTKSMSTN